MTLSPGADEMGWGGVLVALLIASTVSSCEGTAPVADSLSSQPNDDAVEQLVVPQTQAVGEARGEINFAGAADGSDKASRPQASRPPRRIALLIGISDYQHFPPQGPAGRSDLKGPRNDLPLVGNALSRYGFLKGDDLVVLEDSLASLAGIRRGFEWLQSRATEPDDVVLIYYSGHGSWAPDEDGDEAELVEGDVSDEALVPWDASDIHDSAQLVVDDSIRVWLARLPTDRVTLVIDACYSGTITRGFGTPRGPTEGPPTGDTSNDGAGSLRDLGKATVLTAARATEVAIEQPMPGRTDEVYGAFTYMFAETLKTISSGPPASTFDGFMSDLRRRLAPVRNVAHRPQLEGGGSEPLFHIGDGIARRPFAEVVRDVYYDDAAGGAAERLRLPVGRVHGVTIDAAFDVYGPDETEFRDAPAAMLRVDSVTATDAYVSALSISRREPQPGDRAILGRLPIGVPPTRRLRIRFDGADPVFEAEANRLPFVTTDDDRWDAVGSSTEDGPLLRWRDSAEMIADASVGVCTFLRRAYSVVAFQSVANPEPPAGLDVFIRFVPVDSGPPRSETRLDTLYEGRRYDIWMKVDAAGQGAVYASAAYVGMLFDPLVVYPPRRGDGSADPNILDEYAPAAVPDSLGTWSRISTRPNGVGSRYGTELVRLYVGRAQYDFHRLVDGLPSCEDSRTRDVNVASAREWRTRTHEIVILPEPPPGR